MAVEPRMVFLGFGKFARADKIYALEPLRGDQRGDGRRTNVWVDGIDGPIVASRTERTILHDMGQDPAAPSRSSTRRSTWLSASSPQPMPAASTSATSAGAPATS